MIDVPKLAAAFQFLLNPRRCGRPNLKWLFSTATRCGARFDARFREAFEQIQSDGEFQYVVINGETFVWPKSSPIDCLKQILGELIQEDLPQTVFRLRHLVIHVERSSREPICFSFQSLICVRGTDFRILAC
jgi:hypothetical protein